jgi:hypothetical protein
VGEPWARFRSAGYEPVTAHVRTSVGRGAEDVAQPRVHRVSHGARRRRQGHGPLLADLVATPWPEGGQTGAETVTATLEPHPN